MDANLVQWAGQILLALAFLTVAYGHSLGFALGGVAALVACGRFVVAPL